MSNGFTGTILRVNLTTGAIEKQKFDEEFYRLYMGGGAFGTYFLLKETDVILGHDFSKLIAQIQM